MGSVGLDGCCGENGPETDLRRKSKGKRQKAKGKSEEWKVSKSFILPFAFCLLIFRYRFVRSLLSTVYSNQGMNISSQLCSLQNTSLWGAGLYRFLIELS